MTILKSAAAAVALIVASQAAHANTVNFNSANACNRLDVTITPSIGGNCDIRTGDLSPIEQATPNGTGSLVISTPNNPSDSFWTAEFTDLVEDVSVELGDFPFEDADELFLTAYDDMDNELEMVTFDYSRVRVDMQELSLTSSGIAKVEFGVTGNKGNGGIYADNLKFTPIAPIPLPAAGVLLLGALGGMAALRRRKRS